MKRGLYAFFGGFSATLALEAAFLLRAFIFNFVQFVLDVYRLYFLLIGVVGASVAIVFLVMFIGLFLNEVFLGEK